MSHRPREIGACTWHLGAYEDAVEKAVQQWQEQDGTRRLWNGDVSLWTGADENRWLGWLHVLDGQGAMLDGLHEISADIQAARFQSVLLLGMGGSSLCPEVMSRTFGAIAGHPPLLVLDSTSPDQVRRIEDRIDPMRTLFIVSSKSGGTTETNVLRETFFARLLETMSPAEAARHFLAITDPGTSLDRLARESGFRHILHGEPDIGGRYSALSHFGMAPAACMGVDVAEFMRRARSMATTCGIDVPAHRNPGVHLGIVLGTLARAGRDKVTFLMTPEISSLGAWLEQLIAESTGKQGTGIIPVDAERVGPPQVYGDDRVFVVTTLRGKSRPDLDAAVVALHASGHPVVHISLDDIRDLGQEFFRWEIATATAGAVLGIHPFDQPDVESSKVATRSLTAAYEKDGHMPSETPLLHDGNLLLFADAPYGESLRAGASRLDAAGILASHLGTLRRGDYCAILAYLEMHEANHSALQEIRHRVRDARHVATTLGFGPRFLHSTGQLHKGGPDSGWFMQITAEAATDRPIPGKAYTFAQLQGFQARGDFAVLAERRRRALRLHLQGDVARGLARLQELVNASLTL